MCIFFAFDISAVLERKKQKRDGSSKPNAAFFQTPSVDANACSGLASRLGHNINGPFWAYFQLSAQSAVGVFCACPVWEVSIETCAHAPGRCIHHAVSRMYIYIQSTVVRDFSRSAFVPIFLCNFQHQSAIPLRFLMTNPNDVN